MPEPEHITFQQDQLKYYRNNLRNFLQRKAALGGSAHCPPEITFGIEESRKEIAFRKSILREWGVSVEDYPDDFPHNAPDPPVPTHISPPPEPPHVPPDAARTCMKAGEYHVAMELLVPRAQDGEQAAAQMLGEIVEMAAAPFDYRKQAAEILAAVGDPRPGVCTLPLAMVRIEGGTFMIGSTREQAENAGKAFEQYFLDVGDKKRAKQARTWPEDEINDQPVTVATFEISRYLITNAQYQLFIEDGGYDAKKPWWDKAGRAWLQRDDQHIEGLTDWQIRKHKNQPEWWDDGALGKAHPNRPVVGISWYEAVAYCRWLTLKLNDGYIYRLPTEAEWEYAARRDTRRIYPWGNEEPDGERANYGNNHGATTAVGAFPKGATPDRIRIYDMAGNVWEWTGSIYKPYPYDPNDGREYISNPEIEIFVLRGGGWLTRSGRLRASPRYLTPVPHVNNIGFRLARCLP